MRNWLLKIPDRDKAIHWIGLAGMLAAASPFFIGAGLSLASGLGKLADVLLLYAGILLAFRIGTVLLGAALLFMRVKLPRYLCSGTAVLACSLILTLHAGRIDYIGSSALTAVVLIIGYAAGTAVYLLVKSRSRYWLRLAYAVFSLLLALSFYGWLFDLLPLGRPEYKVYALSKQHVKQWEKEMMNPSKRGEFSFHTFTYGSGKDRARAKFGKRVSVITPTVDASPLIRHWDWSRRWIWGFDQQELPLNGKVWMPVGDGPFPLVLMVHGNHSMADYSDEGYDYLGKLLASRGFTAVSIDQNFLNHSTWSGNLGDFGENISVRAWMLLQHLAAIEDLHHTIGNPFYSKVDMDRIAIIGHSRGGQAAVLAAGFNHFFSDPEDEPIRVQREFDIDAVIAIAPTDQPVDGRFVDVDNLHYLLLHGSYDADVNTFAGDRQYKRIDFHENRYYFKSSLYIRGANHGQFNSDWGRRDIGYPTQWLLNKRDILPGSDQRKIAKVYVSAFLETIFHQQNDYELIFQDYRYALNWLPRSQYVSKYANSELEIIADYEDDRDKHEAEGGIEIDAEMVTEWTEEDLTNRRNTSQRNRVVKLTWEEQEAAYVFEFPVGETNDVREALAFSLGNLTEGTPRSLLEVTVELMSKSGVTAELNLSAYPPIPKPIETRFIKSRYLEIAVREEGLSTSAEPVLQSYVIPLVEFVQMEPAFDPAHIRMITFRFEQQGGGTVMLDDIGFYLSPRS